MGVCLRQGSSAGLERWSHKPEVGGSSPPFDTTPISQENLTSLCFFLMTLFVSLVRNAS